MAFGDIPVRVNGKDQIITAEWFNVIRSELINAFGQGGYINETPLQTLSAGSTIALDSEAFKQLIPVESDGGTVVLSSTPFGAGPFLGGKEILLVGTSDTNIVEIPVNDAAGGFVGRGKIILSRFEVVVLIYSETLQRFFRQGDY